MQKYILSTSDFAKSIQTDINHYVTRDRIKNASFRQRLDSVSKNILRRQNPLELVFEDISTFDAKNPIVGSMLREIDVNKKQSDSDFIKSLPSHSGKEFEIKERLDRLGRGTSGANNNNDNNNTSGGDTLFGPGTYPPSLPSIEDLLDGAPRPPPPPPPAPSINGNLFSDVSSDLPIANNFDVLTTKRAPPTIWSKGISNNLFGSQAAAAIRDTPKTKTQQDVDDFLYEFPDTMPDLELGDGLLSSLGTTAQNLFDTDVSPTQKEEEDEVLKDILDEYEIDKIKDAMDDTDEVPESIYSFYSGDSQQFVNALEFICLSPINREFDAFLLSELGQQTMNQNKLSIHVETGEIFYNNHNTGENFYNFLLSQQNDEAAYVPKKFSYKNSFEDCIGSFLQSFSIDDQEKFDLFTFKNSKYLSYRFDDFIKAYKNPRYKL